MILSLSALRTCISYSLLVFVGEVIYSFPAHCKKIKDIETIFPTGLFSPQVPCALKNCCLSQT